ncbi:unknown protein [Seminavis robusta]|uniref:Uncharacterized protein n=1 Tax=Seminavis robusta TaxID=568900 RepID=A0A9N8EIY4_9STRA|nr:unknown protein [Seminavis robusta]|eukprot:Sro1212_g252890.1 n/a (135) ;mRNA; r:11836-12240
MGDDNASVNRRKREAEVRAVAEFRSSISDALSNMSHAALLTELREAENRCVMYEERALTTELPRVKKLYDETVRKLEKRITKIQEMVDAIMEQNASAKGPRKSKIPRRKIALPRRVEALAIESGHGRIVCVVLK